MEITIDIGGADDCIPNILLLKKIDRQDNKKYQRNLSNLC